ncbi:MAG: ECF transporter S component [Marvinbryantia sp.]|uniref:ECF transporter S component n=1 Tax=Marvinbryantia sp. TaxID=2496532 RepID=UPI00399C0EE6
MKRKTKEISTVGMLCAIAYVAVVAGRIPLILFLKYDPKDIVIAISGLIFGPFTSFVIAFIVSLIEMFTISENGVLGFIMNIISSCSFACTAAFIYKRKHRLSGAIIGILCGWGCMVCVMLLWNYLITPIYMGYPREEVVRLLLPAFLPFNFIKGGLNAAITMLLYKPVITALRYSGLVEQNKATEKARINIGVILVAFLIIITCILLILSLNGIF